MLTQFVKKVFSYGDHTVELRTGEMARQADAAVELRMGDTVILATLVVEKQPEKARDFFPLTVDYFEKMYAVGRIPGGYNKREGRPSLKEILTSRIVDRSLRPLFHADFTNEVQIVIQVLSQDPEIDAAIPAVLAASAAVKLAGLPFTDTLAAARVGYKDGFYLLNPTETQIKDSVIDLVVAGTDSAVIMVESAVKELPENVVLGAVMFGFEQAKTAVQAINEFVEESHVEPFEWTAKTYPADIEAEIFQKYGEQISEAYAIAIKKQRNTKLDAIRAAIKAEYLTDSDDATVNGDKAELSEEDLGLVFSKLEEKLVRGRILKRLPRIDGRDERTVRPIRIRTNVLPRTHGSALFTRGETQALVVTTLGTGHDIQRTDALLKADAEESFMLHYNFPPFSVGEIGRLGTPKRRELGHGNLAKRALMAVLPDSTEFPYVLRLVSEILESNGSSSMATVCGGSLALMDAGVPIKAPVAGIAMGLIKEENEYVVLTDILGDEDHLGDMDFKVAGTKDGVTALQMDIKITGITKEIMEVALEQARVARLHILNEMWNALEKPRTDISQFAPRMLQLQISKDKIRDVIGKGGATIRSITEETGVSINISDEGLVQIAAVDLEAGEAAKQKIIALTSEVEIGQVYEGTVVKLADFGAFVNVLPGKDGLVHISQISNERVANVTDYLKEGQKVKVKVMEVDRQGRIKLSMKDA